MGTSKDEEETQNANSELLLTKQEKGDYSVKAECNKSGE